MRSGWLRGSIYWLLSLWGWFSVPKTNIPDSEERHLVSSRAVRKAVPRWIRGKEPDEYPHRSRGFPVEWRPTHVRATLPSRTHRIEAGGRIWREQT